MEENITNEIIDIEAKIQKDGIDRHSLLLETFILWQALVEEIDYNPFTNSELVNLLRRNFKLIRSEFKGDNELNFITGWALSISFWLFGEELEDLGPKLLYESYRKDPQNLLFKWAVRDHLNFSTTEINNMERKLLINLDQYISEPQIRSYFKQLLQSK